MKFAIIVVNINTCTVTEPLKLAFLAQMTYNQPNSHTSRKNGKKKNHCNWSFKNCLACKTTITFNKQKIITKTK